MEIISSRSALLSNYEVFTLLKELENDHLERSKAAMRIKKEETASVPSSSTTSTLPDISENLRTIQVEAIQYLSSDSLPTNRQTPDGISKLVRDLASYDLTKAEKLQIANLAPTLPVELYVIVEELEDRLGDRMDAILDLVKASLHTPLVNGTGVATFPSPTAASVLQHSLTAERSESAVILSAWGNDIDAIVEDEEFIDQGEGTGIEGDLDVDEE